MKVDMPLNKLNTHTHIYHHHVVPLAWISLTLSRHFSLLFITSGRSAGLHPVSSHSCCMYVLAGRPALALPCVRVHRSTSLMSSSLLLQQCPACLVHLTWIVFMMGGRWPYSWCFVGCCHQDLFNIAYIYCYAAMCPTGLQGAIHSRQVHQLKQDPHVDCGLPNAILFYRYHQISS